MRVVIIQASFMLYWIPRLRALALALRARGDELVVVELTSTGTVYAFAECETEGTDKFPEIEWYELFPGEKLPTVPPKRASAVLWRKLEELSPDVVLAGAIAFIAGATAVRWGRFRRRGVTILDNSRLEDVPRPEWVEWVKKRIYRNVDAVLTPAPSHAPSYAHWGIRPDRIFYGLNVVDNAFFEAGSRKARGELEAVRSRLNLRCPFFLGVGRQVAKKNWMGLLAAYERYRLKAGENAWDLVLVGDGEEHPQLERWVQERGLAGVRFDPFCTQAEVCSYHALARCLILPSFYGETWGLVVNEAMASGLPVLVSRQCGCSSVLVREGENGWTFDPGNGKEMTDALERMAGVSDEKWGQMSERSRQIVSEWGLDRFTQGVLEAIDACREVRRGPVSWLDACILWMWNGR